jgi:hypothetical protein
VQLSKLMMALHEARKLFGDALQSLELPTELLDTVREMLNYKMRVITDYPCHPAFMDKNPSRQTPKLFSEFEDSLETMTMQKGKICWHSSPNKLCEIEREFVWNLAPHGWWQMERDFRDAVEDATRLCANLIGLIRPLETTSQAEISTSAAIVTFLLHKLETINTVVQLTQIQARSLPRWNLKLETKVHPPPLEYRPTIQPNAPAL